jgi:hypothetical protein
MSEDPRPMPRLLAIFSLLMAVNIALVSWSVLQKHLWASTQEGKDGQPPVAEQVDAAESDLRPLTAQEQLERLEPPEIVEDAPAAAPDDSLLDEIRKAAAIQFPELSASPDRSPDTPLIESRAEVEVLEAKLEIVVQLGKAALSLIQLSQWQHENGFAEQAEHSIQQSRQLRQIMIELLED